LPWLSINLLEYISICMYMYTCIYIHMNVCINTWIQTYKCSLLQSLYKCKYICEYIYIYITMRLKYICISIDIHVYILMYLNVYENVIIIWMQVCERMFRYFYICWVRPWYVPEYICIFIYMYSFELFRHESHCVVALSVIVSSLDIDYM